MNRLLSFLVALLLATPALAADIQNSGPCSAFGTASGTCAQGGTITAGGPTGAATTVPVITYNAAGQLTAVTTAATGVTTVGTAAVGQIPGATTNTAASAGNIGEYLSTNVASAGVSISTGADTDVGTLVITAGSWLCHGNVFVIPAGTVTAAEAWITTAANTAPTRPASGAISQLNNISTTSQTGLQTGNLHIASAGQTLHLGVNAAFSSTATAYGFIGCLRVQ